MLGITQTEAHSWASAQTLVPIAIAVVLLRDLRRPPAPRRDPLLPLSLLRLPGLAAADAVTLVLLHPGSSPSGSS